MEPKQINVETLRKILQDPSKQGILFDVREQDEWDAGHIPDAQHLPKGQVLEHIERIVPQKDKPIYLHCKSGGRSQQAAIMLINLGYTQVYNVTGGITAWESAGYPIV